MAAITEILEFESIRNELETQRVVHLFQEGSFYRAYEWSAWLMCKFFHDFKVTHRRMKGIEQSVALIGFPVTSLSKWLPQDIERHDVSDKHITFTLPEDSLSELSDVEKVAEAFVEWKSSQPIVEKAPKQVASATQQPPVMSHYRGLQLQRRRCNSINLQCDTGYLVFDGTKYK